MWLVHLGNSACPCQVFSLYSRKIWIRYKRILPVAIYDGVKLKKYKEWYFLKMKTRYIVTGNFYLYLIGEEVLYSATEYGCLYFCIEKTVYIATGWAGLYFLFVCMLYIATGQKRREISGSALYFNFKIYRYIATGPVCREASPAIDR